jgi:hypothetical protein
MVYKMVPMYEHPSGKKRRRGTIRTGFERSAAPRPGE